MADFNEERLYRLTPEEMERDISGLRPLDVSGAQMLDCTAHNIPEIRLRICLPVRFRVVALEQDSGGSAKWNAEAPNEATFAAHYLTGIEGYPTFSMGVIGAEPLEQEWFAFRVDGHPARAMTSRFVRGGVELFCGSVQTVIGSGQYLGVAILSARLEERQTLFAAIGGAAILSA